MPQVSVTTNITKDIPRDKALALKLSSLTAQSMGKPESYVQIAVVSGSDMTFAGTEQPTVILRLLNVGKMDEPKKQNAAQKFTQLVSNELGVPSDRVFFEMIDQNPALFAWNGNTFA